jgi:uncharacterized membrane protein YhaH (DUF805 family)
MWVLLQVIIYFAVVVLLMMFGGGALMMGGDLTTLMAAGGAAMIILILYGLWELVILIPSLAVTVRRLHDTNRSGWWILAPLVPYVVAFVSVFGAAANGTQGGFAAGGIVGFLSVLAALGLGITLLVFMFLEGTRGPNKYGPDPKGRDADQVFA